jgi:hypothetical protein
MRGRLVEEKLSKTDVGALSVREQEGLFRIVAAREMLRVARELLAA